METFIKLYHAPQINTCIARYVGEKNCLVAQGNYYDVLHKARVEAAMEGISLKNEKNPVDNYQVDYIEAGIEHNIIQMEKLADY